VLTYHPGVHPFHTLSIKYQHLPFSYTQCLYLSFSSSLHSVNFCTCNTLFSVNICPSHTLYNVSTRLSHTPYNVSTCFLLIFSTQRQHLSSTQQSFNIGISHTFNSVNISVTLHTVSTPCSPVGCIPCCHATYQFTELYLSVAQVCVHALADSRAL